MVRRYWFAGIAVVLSVCAAATAEERLDHGLVALKTADGKVYLGWRSRGDDPKDFAFNVYRQSSSEQTATRLTARPVATAPTMLTAIPRPDSVGVRAPTYHVHGFGMVADIIAAHPGQECYAGEKEHGQYFLYTAKGERIGSEKIDSLSPRAIWWNGDAQKELILSGRIQQYRGQIYEPVKGSPVAIADCLGDWREEILASVPGELRIYTTTIPTNTRRTCLMQDRQYRLGVAAVSMGYFYWPQLSLAGAARFSEARKAH